MSTDNLARVLYDALKDEDPRVASLFGHDTDILRPVLSTVLAEAAAQQLPGTAMAEGRPPTVNAPLVEVWTVWAEDESALGHYTDEVTAKLAAIEYHQEAETPGLKFVYGWNKHGGHLELLADGSDTGLRVKHDPVRGKTPAPADRAATRDRIRRAICEASGFTWLPDELLEPDEYGDHADAVLAALADDAAAGVQPPTTSEAHPPSYPWSQSVHSVDGGQTIHITWDDPEGNPGGSVRVDASDRNVLAFMLADGAPDPADAPDAPSVRCSVANLRRWPHPPHSWEPQPGMPLVRCPGTPPAAPAAPRIRCAHTDVVYGQCIRYLDDHDGDCQYEQQPAAPAAPEETQ